MEKLNRDEKALNLLRLLDEFAANEGISLEGDHEAIADKVKAALALRQQDPIAIHGLRAQAMFASVASSLGECLQITEEDSGLFIADDKNLRRPDFLVITKDGNKFFVEVKNFSPSKKLAPFTLTKSYLAGLKSYCNRLGQNLKIAVYWRHLGMWTLVSADCFDEQGKNYILSMESAFKRNEMSLLGDCMIGVVPPLAIRFYTDPDKPRQVSFDGLSDHINILRVAICVDGQEITDELERKLAIFFLLHGTWSKVSKPAEVVNNELIWFDIQVEPHNIESESSQEFCVIGALSEMISNHFQQLTLKDGKIHRLAPQKHPGELGILIPANYSGKILRLWRFYLQPNYDGFAGKSPTTKITFPK